MSLIQVILLALGCYAVMNGAFWMMVWQDEMTFGLNEGTRSRDTAIGSFAMALLCGIGIVLLA